MSSVKGTGRMAVERERSLVCLCVDVGKFHTRTLIYFYSVFLSARVRERGKMMVNVAALFCQPIRDQSSKV